MKSDSIRLFIAAALPEPYAPLLSRASEILAQKAGSVSLTKAQNLHLTLSFIGEVSPARATDIRLLFLDWSAGLREAYSCRIDRYGYFKGKDGLTVWAGLEVDDALVDAVDDLRCRLIRQGLETDLRLWLPHLTIARRFKSEYSPNDVIGKLPLSSNPALIKRISLYRSEFTPHGMNYTPLETWEAKA